MEMKVRKSLTHGNTVRGYFDIVSLALQDRHELSSSSFSSIPSSPHCVSPSSSSSTSLSPSFYSQVSSVASVISAECKNESPSTASSPDATNCPSTDYPPPRRCLSIPHLPGRSPETNGPSRAPNSSSLKKSPYAIDSLLSSSSTAMRIKSRITPDNEKDELYWARRRKNNEAAKRSRDTRRAKEDLATIRAAVFERRNFQLLLELAKMKKEMMELKRMLSDTQYHSNTQEDKT